MIRRTWIVVPVLAAGLLLAASIRPGTPAVAQDSAGGRAESGDRLIAEGMTREELVSLYALLAGPSSEPPACVEGDEMFDDVPASHPFCSWIEELARRGITEGCDDDNYCPGNPVTRGQMAPFIVRATPEPEVKTVKIDTTLADGDSEVLLEAGPFTLTATCAINDGGNDVATIEIATSADDAVLTAWNFDHDFDVADSPKLWDQETVTTGTPSTDWSEYYQTVMAVDGTMIAAYNDMFAGVNLFGDVGMCQFQGYLHVG